MEDVAANRNILDKISTLPVDIGLKALTTSAFDGAPLAAFLEKTGIPRQTLTRKLNSLSRRGYLIFDRNGKYKLSSIPLDITGLTEPSYALAKWMLVFFGWRSSDFGTPKSLLSFGSINRYFLSSYIALAKSRRIHTGAKPLISVQISIMLMQVMNVERLIISQGPDDDWSFSKFMKLARQSLSGEYHINQISEFCDIPLSLVRKSCQTLDVDHGLIKFSNRNNITIGGRNLTDSQFNTRGHRFYSIEFEQYFSRFTRNVLERAERISQKSN